MSQGTFCGQGTVCSLRPWRCAVAARAPDCTPPPVVRGHGNTGVETNRSQTHQIPPKEPPTRTCDRAGDSDSDFRPGQFVAKRCATQ
eukprot:9569528-Heterocapsa_arctica.AAC.1